MSRILSHSVLHLFGVITLMSVSVSLCASAQDSSMESRFRHGTEAMRNGALDEAAGDFSAVIHISPRFAEAYFNLGLVREQQGRFDDAITSLQHALVLKPTLRG